jgi:hypothetical protein
MSRPIKRFNILCDIVSGQEKTLCLEEHVKVWPLLWMMKLVEAGTIEAENPETFYAAFTTRTAARKADSSGRRNP